MPYLGTKGLKASDIRRFNVTGSTSATHTLTWVAPTEQSLIVTINGVKQQEDAYSVSGTTLTLTSALVATDKMEVVGINDVGTTVTPAQNSVNLDKLATTGTASSSTFFLTHNTNEAITMWLYASPQPGNTQVNYPQINDKVYYISRR